MGTRGYRRKAREFALQMLFHYEFNKESPDWAETFWRGRPAADSVREFANQLVTGVLQNQKTIDDLIEKNTENWSLDRITPVDRNILRIAIYEFISLDDIAYKITINEAIEIAKRFGDEGSGSFVNGILDHIVNGEPFLGKKGSRGVG